MAQATLPASAVSVLANGPIPLTGVAFTTPPTLSAGTTYAIILTSTAPQLDTLDRPIGFRVGVERRPADPFNRGFFSADNEATWYASDSSLAFNTPESFQITAAPAPIVGSTAGQPGASVQITARPPVEVAAAAADPVIAAAGDIACDPADPNYNGGNGVAGTFCRMGPTSNVLVSTTPAAVLALGDNQYSDGTLAKFQQSYDPTWGRVKPSTHPASGNHEYESPSATGYFAYFGSATGNPSSGYYSFDVGSWHVVVLNGNCGMWGWDVNGCAFGSPQEQWLRADLAAHAPQLHAGLLARATLRFRRQRHHLRCLLAGAL